MLLKYSLLTLLLIREMVNIQNMNVVVMSAIIICIAFRSSIDDLKEQPFRRVMFLGTYQQADIL